MVTAVVRARGARVCGRGALTRAGPERRAEAQALVSRACEPGSRVPTAASSTRRVVTQAAPEGPGAARWYLAGEILE